MKSGSLSLLDTLGPLQACTVIALPIQRNLHKKYYDYVCLNDAVCYDDFFAKNESLTVL
jgi:hypothetical protein